MLNHEEISELCELMHHIPEMEAKIQKLRPDYLTPSSEESFVRIHQSELIAIKQAHDRLQELLAKSAPACGCNGCQHRPLV